MLRALHGHFDCHPDEHLGNIDDHHGDLLNGVSALLPALLHHGRLRGSAASSSFLIEQHGHDEMVAAAPLVVRHPPARSPLLTVFHPCQHKALVPTAFHPFVTKCPPPAMTELGAISAAMGRAKEAENLLHRVKANEAFSLVSRAIDRLSFIQEFFTYLIFKTFMDLPNDLHATRMDIEQAAQNARRFAHGSKAGDLLACAAADLWPYDNHPNIHPMDRRLSEAPWPVAVAGPPWLEKPEKQDAPRPARSPSSLARFL